MYAHIISMYEVTGINYVTRNDVIHMIKMLTLTTPTSATTPSDYMGMRTKSAKK